MVSFNFFFLLVLYFPRCTQNLSINMAILFFIMCLHFFFVFLAEPGNIWNSAGSLQMDVTKMWDRNILFHVPSGVFEVFVSSVQKPLLALRYWWGSYSLSMCVKFILAIFFIFLLFFLQICQRQIYILTFMAVLPTGVWGKYLELQFRLVL